MTTDPLDPPRFEESGPDALRELMRRHRRGPSAADVGKISERLVAAGAMQGGRSGGMLFASAGAASRKIGGAALLVTGGLLVAWQAVHANAPPASAPAAAAVTATDPAYAMVSDVPPAAPARSDAISVNELPSAAPAAEVVSVSASARTDSRRNGTAAGAASPAKVGAPIPSASELELVQRAEAALASDPQRALALASEHARDFPSGEFLQEREVIAIDALAHLGRNDESLRRARALIQRFPQTPYAVRIERAVGQPLTSPSNAAAPTGRIDP